MFIPSTMGRRPVMAAPMPIPTNPFSAVPAETLMLFCIPRQISTSPSATECLCHPSRNLVLLYLRRCQRSTLSSVVAAPMLIPMNPFSAIPADRLTLSCLLRRTCAISKATAAYNDALTSALSNIYFIKRHVRLNAYVNEPTFYKSVDTTVLV